MLDRKGVGKPPFDGPNEGPFKWRVTEIGVALGQFCRWIHADPYAHGPGDLCEEGALLGLGAGLSQGLSDKGNIAGYRLGQTPGDRL